MSRITDDVLLAILKTKRAYSHEVKQMAQELIERRAAEARLAATQPIPRPGNPGLPFPGGLYP